MKVYALTTKDNPYDPFDQWNAWFNFDMQKKYNSCGLLARIAEIDDSMTEEEKQTEFDRAIRQILKYDFENLYRRVEKDV